MSMRFDIPKITRAIRLADYAAEFGEAEIQVWVNPPRALLAEYFEVIAAARAKDANLVELNEKVLEWVVMVWSQGGEDERWSYDEVKQLSEGSVETDPALWPWLMGETMRLINEHRSAVKKG